LRTYGASPADPKEPKALEGSGEGGYVRRDLANGHHRRWVRGDQLGCHRGFRQSTGPARIVGFDRVWTIMATGEMLVAPPGNDDTIRALSKAGYDAITAPALPALGPKAGCCLPARRPLPHTPMDGLASVLCSGAADPDVSAVYSGSQPFPVGLGLVVLPSREKEDGPSRKGIIWRSARNPVFLLSAARKMERMSCFSVQFPGPLLFLLPALFSPLSLRSNDPAIIFQF
jgi:hypothetical protein